MSVESRGINLEDFSEVCRTCSFRNHLIPIFNTKIENINLSLAQLLKNCLDINIAETDCLPQNVCVMCVRKLEKIYSFRNQCFLSDAIFKLILLESRDKTDDHDLQTEEEPHQQTYSSENRNLKLDGHEDHSYFHPQNEHEIQNLFNGKKVTYDCKIEGPLGDIDNHSILIETPLPSLKSETNIESCVSKVDCQSILIETPLLALKSETNIEGCVSKVDNQSILIETPLSTLKYDSKEATHTRIEKVDEDSEENELNVAKYHCTQCLMNFKSRDDLIVHNMGLRRGCKRLASCPLCNKVILRKHFQSHLRTHTKEQPHECEICFTRFNWKGNLSRHMNIHGGEKKYMCELCGKGFAQMRYLQNHQQAHERHLMIEPNSSSFTCSICGRLFKFYRWYNLHMKKHNSGLLGKNELVTTDQEKPFCCDVCEKRFNKISYLKIHKRRHRENQFLCSECGKSFGTRVTLETHLKVHTGEKPHICSFCQKCFATVSQLRVHLYIHLKVKPYKCQECGKNFTQSQHLKRHQRIHSGDKPYICPYCDKRFADGGNLRVHIRIHTGETPHFCEICGKGFYDSATRNKHQRTHNSKYERTSGMRDDKES